ncbi:PGF-pre-PGF domain-containing protein [Methanomethylovorans sp.]|uniref:PGF-pre-PGF domain-containing protein n=1 Tax=Methanomethylovorans sp. TaxID=2758717 RepID=UPI00345EA3C9
MISRDDCLSNMTIGLAMLVILTLLSSPVLAANEVTVSRSISKDTVSPGDTFTVTLRLTTNQNLSALSLEESVPDGWEIVERNSGRFAYSSANNEWVWSDDTTSNITSGTSTSIAYDVTVPGSATAGTYSIAGHASCIPSDGGSVSETTVSGETRVQVEIKDVAPVLSYIGSKAVNENSSLVFTISATDANGDAITYSAIGLPAGATFDRNTGVFSWTPAFTASGVYNVVFVATANGLTDSETVTITVGDVDRAPVLNPIGNKTVSMNTLLSFTISASDPDGDNIVYFAEGMPPGATFDTRSGTFSWVPANGTEGIYVVTFTAESKGLKDSEMVVISTFVDKSTLAAALLGANLKVSAAVPGTEIGQYPQSAIDAFKAVIATVQAIADSSAVTVAQVTQAATDLATAEAVFDASIIGVDQTSPSPVTGLTVEGVGPNWIKWTWTNPRDTDFSYAMIHLDNVFITNTVNSSVNFYNATGLSKATTYTIGIKTVDTSGNINATQINSSATTLQVPTISELDGTNITTNSITLEWEASNDTIKVEISRDGTLIGDVSGVTSYTDGNLTNGTTYSYTLVPYNRNGLAGESVSIILMTSSSTSSGGGDGNSSSSKSSGGGGGSSSSSKSSGGGGGGAGSAEDFANVAMKDVANAYMPMNTNVTFVFTREGNAIQSIGLYSLKNSGQITSTIEILNNRSKLVNNTPEGSIYKYVNIWVGKSGFATADNIKDAKIRFKVNASWMQTMDVSSSDIRLQRYNGNAWQVLPTTQISNATDYVIFESQTPGFSPFAITAVKKASVPTDTDTEAKMQSIASENAGNTPSQEEVVSTGQTESKRSSGWIFVIGIFAVMGIVAGYNWLSKR